MTILNEGGSDGSIELLLSICEFLNIQKRDLSADELIKVFSQGTDKGDKTAASTIKKWTNLGLFSEDEKIDFSDEIKNQFQNASQLNISRAIRFIILKKENNPIENFWFEAEESEKGIIVGDFTRGCSWLLAQSNEEFKFDSWADVSDINRSQLLNKNSWTIRNTTRHQPLLKYSMAMGLISICLDGTPKYRIDPTKAIGEELEYIFNDKIEQTIEEFVNKTSEVLPILDEGVYRKEVESKLDPNVWSPPNSGYLSKSFSLAINRLRSNRKIKTASRSDATPRSMYPSGETITHVIRY